MNNDNHAQNNELFRFFQSYKDVFASRVDLFLRYINNNSDSIREDAVEAINLYKRMRDETEQILRDKFMLKGGKIHRDKPYYLILARRDNVLTYVNSFFGFVGFDINEFDLKSVSFTYGDSISVMLSDCGIGKEYHREVYTYDQICEIIRNHGYPDGAEQDNEPEYIEAQVWTEIPIKQYRIDDDSSVRNIVEVASKLSGKIIKNYGLKSNLQIGLTEAVRIIKNDSMRDWFVNTVESVREEYYDGTRCHGLLHAQKCSFYAYIMTILSDASDVEKRSTVLAALYHDIGRKGCVNEIDHGRLGAELVERYIGDISNIDIEGIKKAISMHNITGYTPENLIEKYVMDSDALDYMRLGLTVFNPKRILSNEGRSLVKMAIELNYILMLNNVSIEDLFYKEEY